MAKISINLLPPDIIADQIKRGKFYKIQLIGIVVILFMIFLTSSSVALSILQSNNITEVQAKMEQQQQKVSSLRKAEDSLFVLKNRLTLINQYLGVPSKQASIYKLIDKLTTSPVIISSITVDKSGDSVILMSTSSSASIDNLINNLTTKENNEDKISQVSIESLNRGRDGIYRLSLKVKAK